MSPGYSNGIEGSDPMQNTGTFTSTPKEQYEARKAARREKKLDANAKESEMVDLLDRFVTAVERIADAMERPQAFPLSNLTFNPNASGGFNIANSFGATQENKA